MTCLLDKKKISQLRKVDDKSSKNDRGDGDILKKVQKAMMDAPWLLACTFFHAGEIFTALSNISLLLNVCRAYSFITILPYYLLSRMIMFFIAFAYTEKVSVVQAVKKTFLRPFNTATFLIGGIFYNSIWGNKAMYKVGIALSTIECACVTGLVGSGTWTAIYGDDYAPKEPFVIVAWIGLILQFLISFWYMQLHF